MNSADLETTWRRWLDASAATACAIPKRAEQLAVMRTLIPFAPHATVTLLDLGCGDGIALESLLRAFPNASEAIGVDCAPEMLRMATTRLESWRGRVRLSCCSLDDIGWIDAAGLSRSSPNVIVSSFAIHHLEDQRKCELLAEVHALLSAPGVFVNLDHVKSRGPRGERLFESWFVANTEPFVGRIPADGTPTDAPTAELFARAVDDFSRRPAKAANRLATVEAQIAWMQSAGFRDADCYWKYHELAVLAGYKD